MLRFTILLGAAGFFGLLSTDGLLVLEKNFLHEECWHGNSTMEAAHLVDQVNIVLQRLDDEISSGIHRILKSGLPISETTENVIPPYKDKLKKFINILEYHVNVLIETADEGVDTGDCLVWFTDYKKRVEEDTFVRIDLVTPEEFRSLAARVGLIGRNLANSKKTIARIAAATCASQSVDNTLLPTTKQHESTYTSSVMNYFNEYDSAIHWNIVRRVELMIDNAMKEGLTMVGIIYRCVYPSFNTAVGVDPATTYFYKSG